MKNLFDKYGVRVSLLEDEDFIRAASMLAEEVFGFGIYKSQKVRAVVSIERCWLMGSEDVLYGRVHFGGQQNTILSNSPAQVAASQRRLGIPTFRIPDQRNAPKNYPRVDVAKDFSTANTARTKPVKTAIKVCLPAITSNQRRMFRLRLGRRRRSQNDQRQDLRYRLP